MRVSKLHVGDGTAKVLVTVLDTLHKGSAQGHSVSARAFIQQRIRHVYRRQRPAPLPSRTAKSRHQSQFGVDGPLVPHIADAM
jgi:hypothetical protein